MSHALPGLPPAPPPPAPVLAASVVLYREGPSGREVLLVRRGVERRFAAGFHAFPGGRLDETDRSVEVLGASGEEAALAACAARELFEETGVLLARGAEVVSRNDRARDRTALLAGTLGFGDLLRARGITLDAGLLAPAGRWVTPEHVPLRYDARMFLAELPAGEGSEIWPGELSGGEFVPVRSALARWEKGELLLFPPHVYALRMLAADGPPALDALAAPPPRARRIEFQKGFLLCAMRTPTLPPATHTNAWIVPVVGGLAVVDPGAPLEADRLPLLALLDELSAEGEPVREVWVTHVHPDHVGAVKAVADRYAVPVRAHALARGRVPGVEVVPMREGDLAGGRFRVLETPGHAREHLAFLDEETGALVCGDLVSTLSTVVIDPPEGDMAEYERQLARVRALGPRTLFPAHGPPAPDAPARLAGYLAHRREREELILAALEQGGTLEEVTERAYRDVPPAFHPVASRSCLATLQKLVSQGRARARGERYGLA